jgi:cystathionine beta-lyase
MDLAEHLSRSPHIRRVFYPGLASHPGHAVAKAQMRGFGAMLSFELDGDAAATLRFLRKLELVKPALSLGGVESTACTPSNTSHRKMSAEARERLGIGDNLVRVSVGIEDVDDLTADFDQALAGPVKG